MSFCPSFVIVHSISVSVHFKILCFFPYNGMLSEKKWNNSYFAKQGKHRIEFGLLFALSQRMRRREVIGEEFLQVGETQKFLLDGSGCRGHGVRGPIARVFWLSLTWRRPGPPADQILPHDVHLEEWFNYTVIVYSNTS